MQLSIRVLIGPHCNLNPDFKHWENLYRESYPLPVIHCPSGYGLSGNKLGSSNQDPLYRKLTGYQKKGVRHTGTRACLYFPREDGALGRNSVKQSALVVTGNFGKDDLQVAAYAFLKNFPDFYRHQI